MIKHEIPNSSNDNRFHPSSTFLSHEQISLSLKPPSHSCKVDYNSNNDIHVHVDTNTQSCMYACAIPKHLYFSILKI